MSSTFNGSFEHTIDPKGRLSIPARFREVLYGKGDDRIMITNFFVEDLRFLDVYPVDEWLRMQEDLKKKAKFDRRMIVFETFYVGNAAECMVDKQGRILIPANLRQYANLKKNVVMTGVIEKFRIWDKEAHQRVVAEAEEKTGLGVLERLADLVSLEGKMLERKSILGISVIDISGDIDFREMIRIKGVIALLIQKEQTKVVLNLKAVDHINYLSIGVLVEQLRALRNLNGDLKLSGMNPYLRNIFRAVGMDQFFEEYPSLEDAVESFDSDWDWDGTYH